MHDVSDAGDVYRLLSRFTVEPFVDMVLRIVNAVQKEVQEGGFKNGGLQMGVF